MNARKRRLTMVLALVALLLGTRHVGAAGFYFSEVGTPGSVGTAGVANPTNTITADAAWTNPAGMTGMTESSILAGLMVVAPRVEFKSTVATAGGNDGGQSGVPGGIPSFFYVHRLSDRWRFGLSLTVPFGGGLDYGDDFVGRYAVQNVSLTSLALTPAFAVKLGERVSLGFGVAAIHTTLDQEIAIRRILDPSNDGKATFDGLEDTAFQGVLGLTWGVGEDTLLGIVYRSQANVDLEGTLKIEGLAISVPDQDLRIQWDNPQWLEIGVRHRLQERHTLYFNAGWQEWSAFSENELSVSGTGTPQVTDRNWDNTWQAGAAYGHEFVRGGYYAVGLSYESSPVKDEDRTFDFPVDEVWKVSGVYGWKPGTKFSFALGATLQMVGDAPIDQTDQGIRAAGEFDSNLVLMLGGTMRYVF